MSFDSGAALEIAEQLQLLELDARVTVLARSERGCPILVESRVGQGCYVHAPLLLGRAIHRGVPGALELFTLAFERLSSAIGISNYRYEPSDVELELPTGSTAHLGAADEAVITNGRSAAARRIRVPARRSAALLIAHAPEDDHNATHAFHPRTSA